MATYQNALEVKEHREVKVKINLRRRKAMRDKRIKVEDLSRKLVSQGVRRKENGERWEGKKQNRSVIHSFLSFFMGLVVWV